MINLQPRNLSLDPLLAVDEAMFDVAPASPVARTAPVSRSSSYVARDVREVDAQVRSASLQLSPTAKWLQASLLAGPPDHATASIHTSAPLAEAASGDGRAMAYALRDSIAHSGLFYESHLAAWVLQQYPESELRQEPQAGWTAAMTADPKSHGHPDDMGDTPISAADHAADEPMASEGYSRGASSGAANGSMPGQVGLDILRAQLQTLESRQLSWHGDVWPGQPAAMTIAQDGATADGDLRRLWRTRLTLTLPQLGQVEVDLRLDGTVVALAIMAAKADSAALLTAGRADLMRVFEANAQTVASISILQS